MRPLILGHRGASAYAPENTMSAIKLAYEQKAAGIEVDIQMTKDNKLVVIHDFYLDRTSNGKGLVKDHTLEELKSLDFGSWFSRSFEGEKIITLDELLEYVKSVNMQLNIEIKVDAINYNPIIIEQINDSLINYDMFSDTIVSSFYHKSLVEFKRINPYVNIGLLYGSDFINMANYAKSLDAKYVHPHFSFIDKELIDDCNLNNIKINTWTVNSKEEYDFVKDNVNIVITNNPDIFIQ